MVGFRGRERGHVNAAPGAHDEYSRGDRGSRGGSARGGGGAGTGPGSRGGAGGGSAQPQPGARGGAGGGSAQPQPGARGGAGSGPAWRGVAGGAGSGPAWRGVAGGAGSGPAWRGARRASLPGPRALSPILLGLVVVGAVLLLVAEFTTLYVAHAARRTAPLQTMSAGAHHSYALVPLALVALGLGFIVWRAASRLGLAAIGVLGVVALLIAVLHDLPDAHAVGLADQNSVSATTTPGVGLYLETLGAILLLAASGLALAFLGLPRAAARISPRLRRG